MLLMKWSTPQYNHFKHGTFVNNRNRNEDSMMMMMMMMMMMVTKDKERSESLQRIIFLCPATAAFRGV